MIALKQSQDTTTLYWNRQGQVNCGAHAPYKGSDTWTWDGWQRIPEYVILHGPPPTCETCRATAGR